MSKPPTLTPKGIKHAPTPSRLTAPFWIAASSGQLLLQRDAQTGEAQFFPRPVNLKGSSELEWVPAAGGGTLIAFSESHVPAKGFDAELPYVMGIVLLDESVRVFAQIIGASAAELTIGQRVRVCWLPRDAGPPVFAFEPEEARR